MACFVGPVGARLQISENGRFLEKDGRPFFWLGDTAWELMQRPTLEEAQFYFDDRAEKGFTIILTNTFSHWGLQRPNVNGDFPFTENDPTRPNEAFFAHVDAVIEAANAKGLVVGLLPTWGDKVDQRHGAGPEIFNPENARLYGKWLGARYADANLVWILGGDRIPRTEEHFAIWEAMAAGLREAVGQQQLMTYHPWGNQGSDNFFHERDWLDFNLVQSGHFSPDRLNFELIERAYDREPTKPVIEAEPCYEDHPINFDPIYGRFTDFEVRRAGYWALLSGAAGHTYAQNNVWQFYRPELDEPVAAARKSWKVSLNYPGTVQMAILRDIFDELPWPQMEPRQDLIRGFIPDPPATPRFAFDTASGTGIAYSPYGYNFTLALSAGDGEPLAAEWIDPRSGAKMPASYEVEENGSLAFDPPYNPFRGNDWVLRLAHAHLVNP
jgi:hypothetical protein